MEYAEIYKSELQGNINAPCSKSAAHRGLICAALAGGTSSLSRLPNSEDMAATRDSLTILGANITRRGKRERIDGAGMYSNENTDIIEINCGESGSTLRFMIPVCAALGKSVTFTGSGRLPGRPLSVFADILPNHGVEMSASSLPLTISGKLRPGRFEVPGDISSQFITGLLLALPILEGDSEIIITTPLESQDYVNMTINIMKDFGVNIERTAFVYKVKGGQKYIPRDYDIEGDWSQAAFFLAAGALSGGVTVGGLKFDSLQGDKEILKLLCEFGAEPEISGDAVTVKKSKLRGIKIDASQIPDLVPILGTMAAFAEGETLIHSAGRVRIKESDRLQMTARGLSAFGIKSGETKDSLTIFGAPDNVKSGFAEGANDHRIVMAFAVLAAAGMGGKITDPLAVNKSYPEFWEDFAALGGKYRFGKG